MAAPPRFHRLTPAKSGSAAPARPRRDLNVLYSVGGTATNGTDYQRLRGRATIKAGASSANIQVRAIDDTIPESDETVILTLSPNASYTIGSPNSGTVTIHSNE